jgi:hypothetical protein
MNELLEKTDAGPAPGSAPVKPVAGRVPEKPVGVASPGTVAAPALPSVQIGKPGYQFKHSANTPQGQDERREHERIRKSERRANHRTTEPPPLPPAAPVDPLQAPAGEQSPVPGAALVPVGVETFVPWVGADISDFTDELVELTESKRVADFVTLAREANMPAKFVAEVEKRSHYPNQSKAALKRTLAECAAKWLNKTGVSSKSKEEVKLLFCMVTIKLQGLRLKKDLEAMIAEDRAERVKREAATKKTDEKI